MTSFASNEQHLSQIPALQMLMELGYEYLSPEVALSMRGGKVANVLLESVLQKQLEKLNRIHYRGNDCPFSEANIQEGIQKLKHIQYDGLQKTNEAVYDLITLGTALEQSVEGSLKSFTFQYIDWKNPDNNVFHVVPEFAVERTRSAETARPDIVLFVNGIPFCVIECKSPHTKIEQAISQTIRNQDDEYIPKLFIYAQLVMGMNKNEARYGTAGTAENFWSVWNELEDKDEQVAQVVNSPLSDAQKAVLFSGEFAPARKHFDNLENEGNRVVTEQDKAIYSLCRPARLLDLAWRFVLYESGIKKIARYQQYFVVRSALSKIKQRNADTNRTGGIVWHSQGSGKSLTMVMLVRSLVLDAGITNPRIILVTDRDDLDKQLGNTFASCGLSRERATTGRNLVKHLKNKVGIITTLIHKFDKGWGAEKFVDESPNIFVLVDESHRTNFGELAGKMRRMLPNACYLGFTGTPLLKKEKSSFAKFGGLIEPHYSIRQAVKDEAVLPLLYEGRHVEMEQNKAAIDLWFERHTADLTPAQQADLKKKYAHAQTLNSADQVIYMRAFDINEHYRANWQGTGFKAQLVAPKKAAALKYHEYLRGFGQVISEVIISAPDNREGHEEVGEGSTNEVNKFWEKMMKRFGSENKYTELIINQFKNGEEPEILIVVDKLLTGFDAPRNTVLYLCRPLKEHTLLQAIARVNRLHEGKDFGYIVDYVSVLGELDKALTMYDALGGFDEGDIAEALASVNEQVQQLPQLYSDLWGIFKEVKNKHDEEEFEVLLADKALRDNFYGCLTAYSKALAIALSTARFLMETDEATLKRYKNDLKRFQNLRTSVEMRYAETVDYRLYERRIKKLLDTHIQANEVLQINEPVNIFDEHGFNEIKDGQGIYATKSDAAKADIIAHATKRVINEKMDEDPALYERFSKLIQQAIDDFRNKRISDLVYLSKVGEIRDEVVSGKRADVPASIKDDEEACAYYGVIYPYLMQTEETKPGQTEKKSSRAGTESGQTTSASEKQLSPAAMEQASNIAADTAKAIKEIINKHWKVDFWADYDAQKLAIGDIDDYLYDEVNPKLATSLSFEQMDEIIAKTMQVARNRRHS
ncbi:MAG: type I restriction endonuclease subunit R [Pseudohongiellaceae bacterium]